MWYLLLIELLLSSLIVLKQFQLLHWRNPLLVQKLSSDSILGPIHNLYLLLELCLRLFVNENYFGLVQLNVNYVASHLELTILVFYLDRILFFFL